MKNFWIFSSILVALLAITLSIMYIERKFSSLPPASLKISYDREKKPTKIMLANSSFTNDYPRNGNVDRIFLTLPYNKSSKNISTRLVIEFCSETMAEVFLKSRNTGEFPQNSWIAYQKKIKKGEKISYENFFLKKIVLNNLFFEDHNTSYEIGISDAFFDVSQEFVLGKTYNISFSINSNQEKAIYEQEPLNNDIAKATVISEFDKSIYGDFHDVFDEDFFSISDSMISLAKSNSLQVPVLSIDTSFPLTIEFCEESLPLGEKISYEGVQTYKTSGIIRSYKVNQIITAKTENRFTKTIPLAFFKDIRKIRILPLCQNHHDNCADPKLPPKKDIRSFGNLAKIQSLVPDYQFSLSFK